MATGEGLLERPEISVGVVVPARVVVVQDAEHHLTKKANDIIS